MVEHHRIFRMIVWTISVFAISSPLQAETELGVAHIGGLYSFTETDYLNEGASAALKMGARCIKVSLSLDTENPSSKLYAFHSDWPVVESLDELADTPYFRTLFSSDFDTFILNTFRPGRPAAYWRDGLNDADEKSEEECIASLTRFLLRKYGKTGKTFVIQNWEGDWALRGSFDPAGIPSDLATASMIRWLAARQRGVERARNELEGATANVFHACEVNLVLQAMEGNAPSVTTDVLPHLRIDLVSYSAWDTKSSPSKFSEALQFIAKHKQPTKPFGAKGVYVGEFGLPESESTPEDAFERTRALLAKARSFGCPYAVYWQLYCNEPIKLPPKVNTDYKGFWIIRPDGSYSGVRALFEK
jgi:hypothetical protein